MRREEKRKAYELKKARREAARAELRQKSHPMVEPEEYVGRLEYVKRGGIVFTDDKRMKQGIIVPTPHLNGATEGDKVMVRLFHRGSARHLPEGEVVRVLGPDGENNAEMNAILAEFGLPLEYPDVTIDIPKAMTAEEILRRRDMRDVLTFTIDPRDAKDFDDALSIRSLEDEGWEVGVHIADVTHYVPAGSDLDEEAFRRGTSVYLVDRVIPMLPEVLSNEVCSLRPGEDKLTYSVVFHLDERAHVRKYKICQTVIRSDYRLTYEQAQQMLEDDAVDPLRESLRTLNQLAGLLRKRRFGAGAVDFAREEVTFDLDEKGQPIAIRLKPATEANFLIEEFMLLANRTVATHIGKELKKPFVYRVHDVPDPDKLRSLASLIRTLPGGQQLLPKKKDEMSGKDLTKLLHGMADRDEKNIVALMAVRAMAKAVYSTENIGHYGLAFSYYTHFTSPIRRYPDIMVHRLLKHYLSKSSPTDTGLLEARCRHCSDMEQLAASAERASIKYKQVEYMQDKMGQEFDGVITGLTDWGIYVEIPENQCEGLIPIRDLKPEDYYDYVLNEFCIRGRIHDRIFRLGDTLRIRIERADLAKKQLDFSLA